MRHISLFLPTLPFTIFFFRKKFKTHCEQKSFFFSEKNKWNHFFSPVENKRKLETPQFLTSAPFFLKPPSEPLGWEEPTHPGVQRLSKCLHPTSWDLSSGPGSSILLVQTPRGSGLKIQALGFCHPCGESASSSWHLGKDEYMGAFSHTLSSLFIQIIIIIKSLQNF